MEESVFAAYGRAMHAAQALEHWLRILVSVHRTASKGFSSQAELEHSINTLSVSTMGTVFAALRTLVHDPNLEAQLMQAVAERNRLAHQYFGQWAEIWVGLDTEMRMVEDADRVRALFEGTVQHLISTLGPPLDMIASSPDDYLPGLNERIRIQSDGEL